MADKIFAKVALKILTADARDNDARCFAMFAWTWRRDTYFED